MGNTQSGVEAGCPLWGGGCTVGGWGGALVGGSLSVSEVGAQPLLMDDLSLPKLAVIFKN